MINFILGLFVAITLLLSTNGVSAQDGNLSSGEPLENLGSGKSFLIPECLQKAEQVRTTTGVKTSTSADCVTDTITFYTNLLLLVVAIGAFLYMLYGAFLYATAFGDDAKATQAKKVITYAIIGVIVAGISAMLVQLLKSLLQA